MQLGKGTEIKGQKRNSKKRTKKENNLGNQKKIGEGLYTNKKKNKKGKNETRR